jgi:nucleoside-diphosphate-sugar epimerase
MAKERVAFVTGFPGFIGERLVLKLLESNLCTEVVCLVEPRFEFKAREVTRRLGPGGPDRRVTVAVGDITDPGLGLDTGTRRALAERVTDVFHLAALEDLAAPEPIARRVNVWGTRHVIEICREISSLERFVHFSTCHVSGTRTGTVYEDELDMGQRFKNHHESTKHDAEYLARQAARELPTIIIRPSIVVGDGETGETSRLDGPYFLMILIDRLGSLRVPLPYLGELACEVNLVPVSYVVDGTVALWLADGTQGGTYALADPRPLIGREIYAELVRGIGAMGPLGRVPPAVLEVPLRLSRVRRLLGVPREILVYLNHPVHHDCSKAVGALEPAGVICPEARSTLPRLVEFYLENRDRPELRWVPS